MNMDCKSKIEVKNISDIIKTEPINQEELEQNEDLEPNYDVELRKYEVLDNDPLKFEQEVSTIKSEPLEQCEFETEEDIELDCDIELGKYEVFGQEWIKVEDEIHDATESSDSNTECCVLCQNRCEPKDSMVCRSCQADCEEQKFMEAASRCLDEAEDESSCSVEDLNCEPNECGKITRKKEDPSTLVKFLNSQNVLLKRKFGFMEDRADHKRSRCKEDMNSEMCQSVEEERKRDFRTAVIDGRKFHSCKLCPFKNTNIIKMKNHMKTEHDVANKPYDCSLCSFRCFQIRQFNTHMYNQHGDGRAFKCMLCSFKSIQASRLKEHMATHDYPSTLRAESCEGKKASGKVIFEEQELKFLAGLLDDRNTYCCHICPYKTINRITMRNHLYAHTSVMLYKCTLCPFISSTAIGLKRHMATHAGKKLYKCSVCSFRSSQASRFEEHLATHNSSISKDDANFEQNSASGQSSDVEIHKTPTDYSDSSKEAANYVAKDDGNNVEKRCQVLSTVIDGHKTHCCQICPYTTTNSTHIKNHIHTHTGYKPYKCSLCPYSCIQCSDLKKHMTRHYYSNGSKEAENCEQNDATLSQPSDIKKHKSTCDNWSNSKEAADCEQKNNSENFESCQVVAMAIDGCKVYCCQTCPYKTTNSSHIRNHVHTHTGYKPYKCSLCPYSCIQSSYLKIHMTRHFYSSSSKEAGNCEKKNNSDDVEGFQMIDKVIEGRKTYYCCQLCSYKTRNSCHMRGHTATHTGYKPYKCSLCTYCCSRPTDLKRHMLFHTELRPHKCDVCSFTCKTTSDLRRHMTSHGEKNIERQSLPVLGVKGRESLGEVPVGRNREVKKRESHKVAPIVFDGQKAICCQICPYKTVKSSDMLKHSYTHTGHKPINP